MTATKLTVQVVEQLCDQYSKHQKVTGYRPCQRCLVAGIAKTVDSRRDHGLGGGLICKSCMETMSEWDRNQIHSPLFKGIFATYFGDTKQIAAVAVLARDKDGNLLFAQEKGNELESPAGPMYMEQNCTKEGPPVSFYGTARLGKQPRRIAAEIEVAHTNGWTKELYDTLKKWNCAVVVDGSLQRGKGKRGPPFEINTAPASGDKWAEMIAEVCKDLRAAGGKANWSCGTHIHVDATKNFGWWDLRRLVRLYAKIEPGMFAIIDPSRSKSTYCIPCGPRLEGYFKKSESNQSVTPHTKIRKFKESMSMGMYGVDAKSLSTSKYTASKGHSSRYLALNLHSWFYRGTVEFRHSHGMTHPEKITNWGLMCASIIDAAADLTESQLEAVPPGVPGLVAIAPSDRVAKWILKREAKFKTYVPKPNPDMEMRDDTEDDGGDVCARCDGDGCDDCS